MIHQKIKTLSSSLMILFSAVFVTGQSQDIDMGLALDMVAKNYDVNIIYDEAHIQGLSTNSVSIFSSLDNDLSTLLKNAPLQYKKIADDTFVIKRRQQKPSLVSVTYAGTIYDSEDNLTLIGANIIEKNTSNGTITDFEGKFTITAEENAEFVISYIGYVDKTVSLSPGTENSIYLEKNAALLEEVVVVGYGSQKKSDLTGAIDRIGVKELKQLPNTGLEQALQGRSAGVYITQNSGSPGGAMSIRIRGTGSTLSAEPLYVVDGIPIVNDNQGTSSTFESDGGGQYSNALTTINPNDIESIEILKDASATAIYGARAANGVVLITTKKGSKGNKSISYDTYMGTQQLYKHIELMNLQQYAGYITETNNADIEEFQRLDLLGNGTDWQDVIFRNAFMSNHQFSFSGGEENTQFSFTGGLHDKDGIVEGTNFTRYSAKLNINHRHNDRITMGVNMLASRTQENITFNDNSNGVIYTALLTPPIVPAKLLNGNFGAPPAGENIVLTFDNPLANAIEVSDVNRKNRLLASFYTDVKITNWLKYRFEVATDILYTNHNTFWPAFQRGTQSRKSRVRRNNNNSLYWINKHLLTFDYKINDDNKFTFLAGFEAQEGTYEWLSATRDNLPTNDLSEINLGDAGTQNVQGGAGHWALLSYFGRLNYNLKDKYLLTSTLRADGSSRFGANNKFGLFPSLAFAWRMSEEPFFQSIEKLNNLKLRLGYGAVGNQEIGLYSFASNLRPTNVVIGNNLITAFAPDNISNPDVKWESSVQLNLGLDMGFYNNRVEVILDIYNKISKDMLLAGILPATAGSLNPPFINIGEMNNKGVELTLNTQNTVGKFNWKTSANVSMNRNEVVDLGSTGALTGIMQRVPLTRTEEGLPIGQFFGHQVESIFLDAAEVAESPFQETGTRAGDLKFKDINEDGVIDDLDKTFIGSPHPDFTVNLINDIAFRNFDFSIFLRGVFGNEVYNLMRRDIAGTGAWHNQSIDVIDRWTPDNPDASEPRSNGNDPNANRRVSDRFIEDGSFVRIQNISLGYTMPQRILGRYNISNLRVYMSAQNLVTFTNYSGYDPEIGSFNQSPILNGIDNGRFPVARSYTLGLNLNF